MDRQPCAACDVTLYESDVRCQTKVKTQNYRRPNCLPLPGHHLYNCIEPYWAWWGAEKRIRIQSSRRRPYDETLLAINFYFKSSQFISGDPRDNRFEFFCFFLLFLLPLLGCVRTSKVLWKRQARHSYQSLTTLSFHFVFGTFAPTVGEDGWMEQKLRANDIFCIYDAPTSSQLAAAGHRETQWMHWYDVWLSIFLRRLSLSAKHLLNLWAIYLMASVASVGRCRQHIINFVRSKSIISVDRIE